MLTSAVIALIATPSSGAQPGHLSERDAAVLGRVDSPTVSTRSERCTARAGYRFYQARAAYWAHRMGAGPRNPEGARSPGMSCPRYLANLWRSKAHAQRRAYERWAERRVLLIAHRAIPGANAWRHAVEQVQRPFPGTRDWLLSCSASEGGWGRWVPNSQGSGVGGWLQFHPSTFSGFYRHAHENATRRGFRVPSSAASWYSPLGQALAGAWAITHGMRSHWAGAGC